MLKPYEDPDNPNNGPKYFTGKKCIEPGCQNPAGTAWSPHWCWQCNARRMARVSDGLDPEIEDAIQRHINAQVSGENASLRGFSAKDVGHNEHIAAAAGMRAAKGEALYRPMTGRDAPLAIINKDQSCQP